MNHRVTTAFLLALGILMISRPIAAHHGTSAFYDMSHPITLKGTVTEFAWTNPHAQVYFDVKDDKGNVVHWGCETWSPGKLARSGWTKNSLKPGDQITITLAPSKKGLPLGSLRKIVLADGKELLLDEMPEY